MIVCNSASIDPPKQIDLSKSIHPQKYDNVDDIYKFEGTQRVEEEVVGDGAVVGGRVLPWTESGGTINAPESYYAQSMVNGKAREVGVETSVAFVDADESQTPKWKKVQGECHA
jgi:hypothetical protein